MTNEDARKHFKGKCPYSDAVCFWWECQKCEIEKQERAWIDAIDQDEEDDK